MSDQSDFLFQTCNPSLERPRIAEGIDVIRNRIRLNEQTTAIVLPPRYGKSDLIRLACIELIETDIVPFAIVLTPWVFLRSQLIHPGKIKAMRDRHMLLPLPKYVEQIVTDIIEGDTIKPNFWEDQPKPHIFAMTIDAARQPASLEILKDAARYAKEVLKKPMLVLIDEGHYVTEKSVLKGWGSVARNLVDCGAHVVLLTGTPERGDNIAPFGFQVKELSRSEDVTYCSFSGRTDEGKIKLTKWEADKVTYQLEANLFCRLSEAWANNIICSLQVRWFTCWSEEKKLSHITDIAELRTARRKALRTPEVIETAMKLAIEDVAMRRQTQRNSALLIFTGNDEDEVKDRHARQVSAIAQRYWIDQFGAPPDVKIATLDEQGRGEQAAAIIARFVGDEQRSGRGDIMIVKQMGGVGLDIDRVKTVLDLSTVRTRSNATQRWLRVATCWKNIRYGTVILPDDQETQSLWLKIVKEQGGEFSVMENGTKVDEFEVDEVPSDHEFEIVGTDRAGTSDFKASIDVMTDEAVELVLRKKPELGDVFSRVEIADMIASGLVNVPSPEEFVNDETKVVDRDSLCFNARSAINTHVADIAQIEAPYQPGANGFAHVERKKFWMNEAKRTSGIDLSEDLKECRDLSKLSLAEKFLTEVHDRIDKNWRVRWAKSKK